MDYLGSHRLQVCKLKCNLHMYVPSNEPMTCGKFLSKLIYAEADRQPQQVLHFTKVKSKIKK